MEKLFNKELLKEWDGVDCDVSTYNEKCVDYTAYIESELLKTREFKNRIELLNDNTEQIKKKITDLYINIMNTPINNYGDKMPNWLRTLGYLSGDEEIIIKAKGNYVDGSSIG